MIDSCPFSARPARPKRAHRQNPRRAPPHRPRDAASPRPTRWCDRRTPSPAPSIRSALPRLRTRCANRRHCRRRRARSRRPRPRRRASPRGRHIRRPRLGLRPGAVVHRHVMPGRADAPPSDTPSRQSQKCHLCHAAPCQSAANRFSLARDMTWRILSGQPHADPVRWLLAVTVAALALAALGVRRGLDRVALAADYDATLRVAGAVGPGGDRARCAQCAACLRATDPDVFFGLGFAHAQDRLWQMTIAAAHRPGPAFGTVCERTLAVDRLLRQLDLYGLAQQSVAGQDGYAQAALDAYSAGFNAWLDAVNRARRAAVRRILSVPPGNRALDPGRFDRHPQTDGA